MPAGGTHVSGQGKAQQMTHRPWHTIFDEALVKEQETNNSGLKKKGAKTRTKGGNSGRQVTGGGFKALWQIFIAVQRHVECLRPLAKVSFGGRCKWRQQLSMEKPLFCQATVCQQ